MGRRSNARKTNRQKQATDVSTPRTPTSKTITDMTSPAPENIMAFGGRSIVSPFIDGDLFQQEVQVRTRRERKPMNPIQRLKARAINLSHMPIGDAAPIEQAHSTLRKKQFTVTTKARRLDTFLGRILHLGNPDDFTYAPSGVMVRYINWTFKSSFAIVFLSFVTIFLLLVFVFGLFFKWAGEAEPGCIIVAGKSFDYYGRGTTLEDGFGLSWTTFTTVGYGSIYIATGNDARDENGGHGSCVLITLLSTAESFIGLLYAGICTAIMFGKIGRIQSHAQVTFSDAVCVEYGQDKNEDTSRTSASTRTYDAPKSSNTTMSRSFADIIEEKDEDISEDDEDVSEDDEDYIPEQLVKPQAGVETNKKILCPVIKFQLINELCNEGGGEILDARMNVMVRKEKESYPYEPIARFLRVDLEEPTHPFFNRVWHGRHILDENSPLVSVEARNRIRMNKRPEDPNSYWPEDLNNPQGVREHLRFSSLIITMTGVSNISAESVQISKRYYKHDVLVGYTFAPLLFKQEGSEMLKVDMSLVNDVTEQFLLLGEKLSANEQELPSLRENDVKGSTAGIKRTASTEVSDS